MNNFISLINLKVTTICFILIMALGYGLLYKLQGTIPTMTQRVILTSFGLIFANLISWQWGKEKAKNMNN